jgi:hypothetical protein
VESVIAVLEGKPSSHAKFERLSSTMLANLNQQEHAQYEQGLVLLGGFLGAESFKPTGKGRAERPTRSGARVKLSPRGARRPPGGTTPRFPARRPA